MLTVIVLALTGMVFGLGRERGDAPPRPAQPAAAIRPLPKTCTPTADGGATCNLSPAGAAPYLGFTPQRPDTLPPGIHLVGQELRSADPVDAVSPSSERSTGYFQRWAPVGAEADAAGQYRQQLLLVQRAAAVGESAPGETGGCTAPARLITLATARAACETAPSMGRGRVIVWNAYGVVSVLEADDVSRAQVLQFAVSFP
jgi:hypothetical protein